MWSDLFDNKDFRKCVYDYSIDELKFLWNFFDDELYLIQMTLNCCSLLTNRDFLLESQRFCLDYRDFIKDVLDKKEKDVLL